MILCRTNWKKKTRILEGDLEWNLNENVLDLDEKALDSGCNSCPGFWKGFVGNWEWLDDVDVLDFGNEKQSVLRNQRFLAPRKVVSNSFLRENDEIEGLEGLGEGNLRMRKGKLMHKHVLGFGKELRYLGVWYLES